MSRLNLNSIFSWVDSHTIDYPTAINLNYRFILGGFVTALFVGAIIYNFTLFTELTQQQIKIHASEEQLQVIIQELQLKLFAAEQALVELQNSTKDMAEDLLKVKEVVKPDYGIWSLKFWRPIIFYWVTSILKSALNLIPDMVSNVPYVGSSIKVLVALYSNIAEQPIPKEVLLSSFAETKADINHIKAALEVMRQAHNFLGKHVKTNCNILSNLKDLQQNQILEEFKESISNSRVTTGSGMQMESTALPADFFDDIDD